ncbi:hypothetical protein [Halorubrum tropicale]|uniref:Uncharacterized protein n=1 Tax=Halorubrum tropicale TaxID=1765655 RepID=A0A0M9ANH6_9EURY|nr:hypothetical protein [Halorubrum tropicale]KOX94241.1 hypothetical protein AMR74_16180 [Halorubrum tropicale]
MTRRSKRELERALEELDIQTSERETTTEIEEHCSEDVVDFVYGLARDLLRISWHNADEVVNETEPEATLNYLELVREQYGIDDDRDEEVCQRLLDATSQEKYWDSLDSFSMRPVYVAAHRDPETEAGETLAELVDEGREEEAEQLLVEATYDLLAGEGGGVEVVVDP